MLMRTPLRAAHSVLASMLFILTACPLLHADTVELKNGDHLTGTAVKLDGGKLTFKTVTVLRSAADEKTYEASLHPSWGHAWAGAANVSLALAHGNSNTATFGAGLTAARTTRCRGRP